MASHAPNFGRSSVLPLPAVLASIPSFPRPVIERLVARMIEHLDEQDGDPDLEDGTDAEDEGLSPWAMHYGPQRGAGCPVSDAGERDNRHLPAAPVIYPTRISDL